MGEQERPKKKPAEQVRSPSNNVVVRRSSTEARSECFHQMRGEALGAKKIEHSCQRRCMNEKSRCRPVVNIKNVPFLRTHRRLRTARVEYDEKRHANACLNPKRMFYSAKVLISCEQTFCV